MKLAVVLFNLGGPDSLAAVRPFLQNLFSDRAIIALPGIVRLPLAWFIAKQRTPISSQMYADIGGKSPIVEETQAQGQALEAALQASGHDAKCFIAMRYWRPFTDEAVQAVKACSRSALFCCRSIRSSRPQPRNRRYGRGEKPHGKQV